MYSLQLLLLFLYLAPSSPAEYYDYERRLKYQVSAYDWSYEEVPPYMNKVSQEKPKFSYWNLWWKAAPWAVGIRARYSSEQYLHQRCMGVLVQKYYVITFCSCVCTWYASNRDDETRIGVGNIHTPDNCDRNYDIQSGKLYVFFQFETDKHKGIVTESLEVSIYDVPSSPDCDAAIDSHTRTSKLYTSFVIMVLNKAEVDLILDAASTNMYPPWPPSNFKSNLVNLNITSYGAKLLNAVIRDENGNSFSLEHRLISVNVKPNDTPYQCPNPDDSEKGICLVTSLREVCGLLPGSPLIGYNKKSKSIELIGLVENHMSCYIERHAETTPVSVIPLSRAMELWANVQRIEATEKAQYDIKDVPWNDKTTPTYFDLFPPDSLKELEMISPLHLYRYLSRASTGKEESFAILSISVLIVTFAI